MGFGYRLGSTPTAEQYNQSIITDEANNDIRTLAHNYGTMWKLCEDKFNLAIDGDLNSAIRLNGQIDAIRTQSVAIENKWSSSIKPL